MGGCPGRRHRPAGMHEAECEIIAVRQAAMPALSKRLTAHHAPGDQVHKAGPSQSAAVARPSADEAGLAQRRHIDGGKRDLLPGHHHAPAVNHLWPPFDNAGLGQPAARRQQRCR